MDSFLINFSSCFVINLITMIIKIIYFRLSNTNEAGVWMFRIGNIDSDKNVEEPNLPHFPFKERTFI